MISDRARAGYESCTACKLCVLPCPVWQQTRDLSLTLMGRARALQGGATASDVRASLEACVLCGACEPVCPEEIDTVGRTLELRATLGGFAAGAPRPFFPESDVAPIARGRAVILPGPALSASSGHLAQLRAAFPDAVLAVDDGRDLAFALEAGEAIDGSRLQRFLAQLAGAREILVAEGILVAPLLRALPGIPVRGLGEAFLPLVASSLGPRDLYVVESRAYHASFSRLVAVYAEVRATSGAAMNLDLHRIAIPTGATSLQARLGSESGLNATEQIRWLLEGRDVSRIVCESLDDANLLHDSAGFSVVHVSSLFVTKAKAA